MTKLWLKRTTPLLCVAVLFLTRMEPLESGQGKDSALWKGELRVLELGIGEQTLLIEYDYDLYQNQQQMVRRELTYMSRNPIAEVGREIQLIDYSNRMVLAYDKHKKRALRYPLKELGRQSDLGVRVVLGHPCAGTKYEIDNPGDGKHIAEVWVARDVGFKQPLLRIEYNFGPDNALKTFSIATVTQLETVDGLPEVLFTPPGGLEIIEGSGAH